MQKVFGSIPSRQARRPGLFLLCMAFVFLLPACTDEHPPASARVIVLGFDGMDPELARRWMDEGKLPNFSRLAREGTFQPLGTSNPPQSPVAWSNFATGTRPGEHGIFDFLHRDPGSYAPEFSISKSYPPEREVNLFGVHLPLSDGKVINQRQGTPFWMSAEERGRRASVLRVPVTFPPDPIHRMLAGMGVPDLLGTQGTYTLYTTTRVESGSSDSRVIRVRPDSEGSIATVLEGPGNPLVPEEGAATVPLTIAPAREGGAHITLDGQEMHLAPGEWSSWVRLEFELWGPFSVTGTVRLLLVQDYPRPRLYVSPIQIDPRNPAVALSSPPDYSAELAERIGDYHTIGMPEETWSLNEEHIGDEAYIDMVKTILAEREAMWYDTLDQRDSELVIGVFVQTDRISHMFYRGLDSRHPRHADAGPLARGAIEWIYREADRVLGETLDRMQPDDRLIVISDHGFAPFRESVHLNRWLVEQGYLVLAEGAGESPPLFASVDWSRSSAYALGLNGIYLNLSGREAQGIVDQQDAPRLKQEIASRLGALRHPESGAAVVRRVFDGAGIYAGAAGEKAPDLVVGYGSGFRASWQTTLGAVPPLLLEPNRQKWSGDHCIDPELVPGVLFTSFPLDSPMASITGISGLVEALNR